MDLSKLSDADLQALAAGDMRSISTEGLQMLAGGPAPRFKYGATDAALQGASFGFSDEVGAFFQKGKYEDNLRDRHAAQALYERENPGEALAAELGGAAAISLIPGAAAFNAARAPAIVARLGPTGARYLGAALGGATAGALTGAGTAEPGHRMEGAARGGATGAALGPLATGALQATGRVAQVARDATVGIPGVQQAVAPLAGMAGATTDFTRRAQEKLLQAMQRDRINPATVQPSAGVKPETLIERSGGSNVLGLADVATKFPGEAKRMASDLAEERMGGQAGRVTDDLSQAFRVQGDPFEVAQAMAATRQMNAGPLYQRAYAEGQQISDPRVAQFMELPSFRRAYGIARRLAQYDGVTLPPDPRAIQAFDLRTLDYVKRGLDDVLYQARVPGPGGTGRTERAKIAEAQQGFLGLLDQLVPSYAQARAAWAGPTAMREALEAGQDFARLRPAELQRTLAGMTEAQVEQFKIGALAALRDKIGSVADGRDLVRVVYGSPDKRAALAHLVGDDFPALEQQFLRERAIRRTDDTLRGNSRTAERQAGMEDLGSDVSLLPSLASQGPVRGGLSYLLRSGSGVAQPTADALGPMMFSTDPRAQQRVLEELMALDRIMRQRAAGAGAGVGSGAGAAGGLLQD